MNYQKRNGMKNITNTFDFIVYGASLWGIAAAVKLADAGKSVILLNHFGFPGGSITESLNCFQRLNHIKPETVSGRIAEEFKFSKTASTNEQELIYTDPEKLKYLLQTILESKNILALFHVKAHALEFTESKEPVLRLSGKEGLFTVKGRTLIDATEVNFLAAISGLFDVAEISANLNMIITGELPEEALCELNPVRLIKITDNRLWLSVKVTNTIEKSIEAAAQNSADIIDSVIRKFGARIQVLPAALHRTAVPAVKKDSMIPAAFLLFQSITDKKFNTDEQFSAASEIELNILNKTGLNNLSDIYV